MVKEEYSIVFTVYPFEECYYRGKLTDRALKPMHFYSDDKELPLMALGYIDQLIMNKEIVRVFVKVGIVPDRKKYPVKYVDRHFFKEKFYYKWSKKYDIKVQMNQSSRAAYIPEELDFDGLYKKLKLTYMKNKLGK